MTTPPTKRGFGDWADLDVRSAWRDFGGLSVEEAAEVFIQNPFGRVEHFRWIAPEAFVFYFPIVLRYVTSGAAKGDSDTISSLAGILEQQIEEARGGLAAVGPDILAAARHIIENYSDFDLDYDIYGDTKGRYERVARSVEPSRGANRE